MIKYKIVENTRHGNVNKRKRNGEKGSLTEKKKGAQTEPYRLEGGATRGSQVQKEKKKEDTPITQQQREVHKNKSGTGITTLEESPPLSAFSCRTKRNTLERGSSLMK